MKLNYKPFHVCSITGCYNLTRTSEHCKYHAYRLKKYGSATFVKAKKIK